MEFPGYTDPGIAKINSLNELTKQSIVFLDNMKKHLGDESIQTEVVEGDAAK